MLDFPLPLRPVMELKLSSLRWSASASWLQRTLSRVVYHPDITVRTAYDLKPCKTVNHLLDKVYGECQRERLTSTIISVTLMAAG